MTGNLRDNGCYRWNTISTGKRYTMGQIVCATKVKSCSTSIMTRHVRWRSWSCQSEHSIKMLRHNIYSPAKQKSLSPSSSRKRTFRWRPWTLVWLPASLTIALVRKAIYTKLYPCLPVISHTIPFPSLHPPLAFHAILIKRLKKQLGNPKEYLFTSLYNPVYGNVQSI